MRRILHEDKKNNEAQKVPVVVVRRADDQEEDKKEELKKDLKNPRSAAAACSSSSSSSSSDVTLTKDAARSSSRARPPPRPNSLKTPQLNSKNSQSQLVLQKVNYTRRKGVGVESIPLYISSTIDIIDQKGLNYNQNQTSNHLQESTTTTAAAPASSSSSSCSVASSSSSCSTTSTDITTATLISSPSSLPQVLNLPSPLVPAVTVQLPTTAAAPSPTTAQFMDIQSLHPVLKSFLVGSVSGTCSTVLFQPLDLVKTRLQQQTPLRFTAAATTTAAAATAVPQNGTIGMFTLVGHIVRDEKVTGLWKGMTPALTRCVPGVGLYFASIHSLKLGFGIINREPTALESIALGITGRSFSGVAMIPFTVIKTRYESKHYEYKSMRSALFSIYQLEGWRGLTSGLTATLLRDAPFSGIYLMMYTSVKKLVPKEYWTAADSSSSNGPSTSMSAPLVPYLRFSCGIVAGLGASLITQPADVIKTKMQLFPNSFTSIPSAVIYVYQRYGLKGYFKGLVPRMMRRTLVAAMSWTLYEQLMSNIGLK